ncbi:LysE family translocator [Thalassotalea sp. HSM 43]|uniref:LysE family translocator n=1 Tax=Thalassotalea sp. HSM 43 TaxID=2552945 RepID=UPI00108014CF|nr:LysE family transporter [Thalassotalea sp. HSM 43]QBY05841.1 LysE family translocator [Thalassotalea sp. HSM 43]
MDFSAYYSEFLTIALAHLLAVASPGPDFAIVVKQSLTRGRQAALFTSAGIGTAILLHVFYSLVGIAIIIKSNPQLFTYLTYIAAAYLAYIGVMGLRAKPGHSDDASEAIQAHSQSRWKSYATGFLVNGLNVKATLFFLSLFSVVISAQTPTIVKSAYGFYMAMATFAWFSFLSCMLTLDKFRHKLQRNGYWIERIMGALLIILAINIVVM